MGASDPCRSPTFGQNRTKSVQPLLKSLWCCLNMGLKLSLGLILVDVVGPLQLVGRWDGTGAPGALLDGRTPVAGVGLVKTALSLWRGGARTLVGKRRGGALVMRLQEGLVCDAVARRGSRGGVRRGSMDALQAWAQVQSRTSNAVVASIRRGDTR